MADELVFYTNPMSRGRVVRWMLEEIGQPYRTVIMEYGQLRTPEYLAINPIAKVPALTHGAAVATEVAGICAYLADAFPQAGLAPAPGDPARAAYYRWLFFAAGPLEAAVTDKRLGAEPTPEQRPMVGYGTFAETLDVIEQAVSRGDYLAGGRFSAADLYLAAHLSFGMMFGTIEPRRAFAAYAQRMQSRPAYARAAEIDDALMPKR
jgi:glutathione S-transferase